MPKLITAVFVCILFLRASTGWAGALIAKLDPPDDTTLLPPNFTAVVTFTEPVIPDTVKLEILPPLANPPILIRQDGTGLEFAWSVNGHEERTYQLVVTAQRVTATHPEVATDWQVATAAGMLKGMLNVQLAFPYGRPAGGMFVGFYRQWPPTPDSLYRLAQFPADSTSALVDNLPRLGIYPVLVGDMNQDGELAEPDLIVPYVKGTGGIPEPVVPADKEPQTIDFRVIYLDPANPNLKLNDYFSVPRHFLQLGSGWAGRVMSADLPKIVMLGLHRFQTPDDIAKATGIDLLDINAALESLTQAGLAAARNYRIEPQLLLIEPNELAAIDEAAQVIAGMLINELLSSWPTLEEAYNRLSLAQQIPFKEFAFSLVGGNLLETRLVAALQSDGSLVTPPETTASGVYYGYLIASSDLSAAGRYGVRSHVQDARQFLSFGDLTNGAAREARYREALMKVYRTLGKDKFYAEFLPLQMAGSAGAAQAAAAAPDVALAAASFSFQAPVLTAEDIAQWRATAELALAQKMAAAIAGKRQELLDKFNKLHAHNYAPLGHFIVLALRRARDQALDHLIEQGKVARPPDNIQFWIWRPASASSSAEPVPEPIVGNQGSGS